ncbi:MAG: HAD hydrolase family protein [Candidatus Cloacimonetes bacterium]|nr:HAD hydrolase family protein [Candidatus Cloacimonadota bacterium]
MHNLNYIKRPVKRIADWHSIRLLVLDCDGVLTDGRIIYGNQGQELKHFCAKDGLGIMLLAHTDIEVAVITGLSSEALERRCNDLKIRHLYQGVSRKLECLDKLLAQKGLSYENAVYLGDDWNDVPCMHSVAFSACPADAHEDVQSMGDYVLASSGGHGAVREFIEYILHRKGIYEQTLMSFLERAKSGSQ